MIKLSTQFGHGSYRVVNLFSLCTDEANDLWMHDADERNDWVSDHFITKAFEACDSIAMFAWGNLGKRVADRRAADERTEWVCAEAKRLGVRTECLELLPPKPDRPPQPHYPTTRSLALAVLDRPPEAKFAIRRRKDAGSSRIA